MMTDLPTVAQLARVGLAAALLALSYTTLRRARVAYWHGNGRGWRIDLAATVFLALAAVLALAWDGTP